MKTVKDHNTDTEIHGKILNIYSDRIFCKIDKDLFFDGHRVHPEFPAIMSVPTTHHTTFRFNSPRYFSVNSDKPKNELIDGLHGTLNRWLKCKHRGMRTGLNTARFIYSLEHGSSVEDEVHLHLLTHIHLGVRDLVMNDVTDFFLELECKPPPGVASMKTTTVYDNAGIVSYICKVEQDTSGRDRGFKKFRFSRGFISVIRKKLYKPLELPDPIPLLVVPLDRSDKLQTPLRSGNRYSSTECRPCKAIEVGKYPHEHSNPSCRSYFPSPLAIRPDGYHVASGGTEKSKSPEAKAQRPQVCPLQGTQVRGDPQKKEGSQLHERLPGNDWHHLDGILKHPVFREGGKNLLHHCIRDHVPVQIEAL